MIIKINNILKLEGYGLYVTFIQDKLYQNRINPRTEGPTLDPDGCIEWVEMQDPPNQAFLNIVNSQFGTNLGIGDFKKYPTVSEIKALANTPALPAPHNISALNKMIEDVKKARACNKEEK